MQGAAISVSKTLPGTGGALAGIRVLELANPYTAYCGKLFADMGADVVLIEPPGGSVLRREAPFIADEPGLERSLAFAYHNTSKRGITLNLDAPTGRALFLELAGSADLVLEGETPGTLERWGLGYDTLRAARRSVVLASVTPFGQAGPYAQFEGEDLVGLAMGGFLYLSGYPDGPPMRAFGNQGYLGASMYAAVAAMLALTAAELEGEGEHVDVSMQECVVMAMETAVQYYDLERTVRKRFGAAQRYAGTGVFECKDGYVYMMAAGIGANKFWGRSLAWLEAEGVPGVERLHGERWLEIEFVQSDEAKRIFHDVFSPWARGKTKAELYHNGQKHQVPLAPVSTCKDILASRQLAFRNYFVSVAHPECETPITMPGAPYKLSRTPWQVRRPAPRLGEHNAEVYGGLGRHAPELQAMCAAGVI